MMFITVKLTIAGEDAGPFDIYTNADGFTTPVLTDVPKEQLQNGIVIEIDETKTSLVRICSTGICENYIDVPIKFPITLSYTNRLDEDCGEGCLYSYGDIKINGEIVYNWDDISGTEQGSFIVENGSTVTISGQAINTELCPEVGAYMEIYKNGELVDTFNKFDAYTFTIIEYTAPLTCYIEIVATCLSSTTTTTTTLS